MWDKRYFVYILSNRFRTVFYIGVTSNLSTRIDQHRIKSIAGFTAKYNLTDLVYAETFDNIYPAISREKQLKGWTRAKKLALIKTLNPELKEIDL
jgi:putative endonuclease